MVSKNMEDVIRNKFDDYDRFINGMPSRFHVPMMVGFFSDCYVSTTCCNKYTLITCCFYLIC